MLLINKERKRETIGKELSIRSCPEYKVTYKPLLNWLIQHDIKLSEFAKSIDVPHTNFIHWLESNDPHVSTLLKIIIGTKGELNFNDFIEKIENVEKIEEIK